jgi:bifunctional UDP-N-acetylglucosamine pyrophosphorylase/glucosamine-1-phosphate N-acetyltransferase
MKAFMFLSEEPFAGCETYLRQLRPYLEFVFGGVIGPENFYWDWDVEALNPAESDAFIFLSDDRPAIDAGMINHAIEWHNREKNEVSVLADKDGLCGMYIFSSKCVKEAAEVSSGPSAKEPGEQANGGVSLGRGDGQILTANCPLVRRQKFRILERIFGKAQEAGLKVGKLEIDPWLKANSALTAAEGLTYHKLMVNAYWAERGVTIMDFSNAYIAPDVKIGKDTVIYPGTILETGVVIGEGCRVGPDTRLSNVRLGDRVNIQYSVGADSEIGDGTNVGPFAYIRPGSKIGKGCKIGDFVEVKNSTIGDGTHASHLTYVGDSDVGANVNFGCGTVTVNYDGRKKYRTVINDNAFIGCNTNLIAPVTVGTRAFTAAGSTITQDVPEDALAVARARQVNKTGWRRP